MATTEYTIYLVNEKAKTQVFWCFLAPPEELASEPDVYANSSTCLAVDSHAKSLNSFTIPMQYVVEAGASNNAVGENIKIVSNCRENVSLKDVWDVQYATVPPPKGPSMKKQSKKGEDEKITINTNDYDQTKNEDAGWYSSVSFGIKTEQGFVGTTWSPGPEEQTTLTPVLKFYVATGKYEQHELAKWTTISKSCAEINVPDDFEHLNTTVTLTSQGHWEVKPGKPKMIEIIEASTDILEALIKSQGLLSAAQKELVGVVKGHSEADIQLGGNPSEKTQTVKLVSVKWDKSLTDEEVGNTYLTGTITVSTALIASFSMFVLSGVNFSVTNDNPQGRTTFSFSYSGTKTIQQIKDMLVIRVQLFFSNPRSLA